MSRVERIATATVAAALSLGIAQLYRPWDVVCILIRDLCR